MKRKSSGLTEAAFTTPGRGHTGQLVATAASGLEEEVRQGVQIPPGRGFAGRIAAKRRAMILNEVDHTKVINPILLAKGIKSLMGAQFAGWERAAHRTRRFTRRAHL